MAFGGKIQLHNNPVRHTCPYLPFGLLSSAMVGGQPITAREVTDTVLYIQQLCVNRLDHPRSRSFL